MTGPIDIGSTLGTYRIEAQIGRGGMGVVYRAEQAALGRQVAIKVIAPELASNEAFRERFKRESRLAAAIEHPNAIPIYEAGEDGDILYLAMRYVEGVDMRSLIADEGPLEPQRAAQIIDQIAGALDEAHAHGLVHRDVKPANILISNRRGGEHAFLTDFGLTKDVAGVSALTAAGQWMGTVDYACPEQIEGKRVDARADVYALGCVLFEALTGRVPFPKESELAKLYAHANEEPPRLSEIAVGAPPRLDDVLARSLAKVPRERFPSAGDLGRAAVAASAGAAILRPERTVAAGAASPASQPSVGEHAVPTAPAAVPGATQTPTNNTARTVLAPAGTAAAPAGGGHDAAVTDPIADHPPAETSRAQRIRLAVGGLVAAAALAVGAFAVLGGGDDAGRDAARSDDAGGGDKADDAGSGDRAGGGVREGGSGGGSASGLEFEQAATNSFSVDIPKGWTQDENDNPLDGDPSILRSTFLDSPSAPTMRLEVTRDVDSTLSPAEQAAEIRARQEVEGATKIELLDSLTVGGRDSARLESVRTDRDFGPESTTIVHFLTIPGMGGVRINTHGPTGVDRDLLLEIGQRATASYEPGN